MNQRSQQKIMTPLADEYMRHSHGKDTFTRYWFALVEYRWWVVPQVAAMFDYWIDR